MPYKNYEQILFLLTRPNGAYVERFRFFYSLLEINPIGTFLDRHMSLNSGSAPI